MMKLLKYDWKRNANTFLGLLAILVIVQIILSIIGKVRGWDESVIVVSSFIFYVTAGIITMILVCKTFESNIKAYHRRLLPVHPAWTVLSSLLLGVLTAAVVAAFALVHAFIYFNNHHISYHNFMGSGSQGLRDLFLIALTAAWGYILLLLIIFAATTIGASISIRGKAGTWISILSFFMISSVMGWLEGLLFGDNDPPRLRIGVFHLGAGADASGAQATGGIEFLSFAPFLYEAAFAGVMFYAMTYLLRKKMEI